MQLENIQVNKLSCPEFNTLAQGLISRFPKGCSSPFYYTPPRSLYDIHIIGWDYTKSKIVPVNALQIAHVTVCKASPLSYLSCNKEANTRPYQLNPVTRMNDQINQCEFSMYPPL